MADKIMKMNITVDDGSRRVPIMNTSGEEIGAFTFHPTDIGIIERFNRMAEQFDAITEPLSALNIDGGEADLTDPKLRKTLGEAEKRMNEAVNQLFGSEDAAEAFFGRMHPFSPVNGEFYCAQVLEKVGAFIGAQFDTETRLLARLKSEGEGAGALEKTGNRAGRRRVADPDAAHQRMEKYLK